MVEVVTNISYGIDLVWFMETKYSQLVHSYYRPYTDISWYKFQQQHTNHYNLYISSTQQIPQPAITFPTLQYQMLRLNTIRCCNNIPRSAIPDPITARIKFTLDCSPPTRTLVAVSSNPYQPARPKGIQPEKKIVWLLCVHEYFHCHTVLSTWRTLQFSGSITNELANGRITAEAIYKFCVLWKIGKGDLAGPAGWSQ